VHGSRIGKVPGSAMSNGLAVFASKGPDAIASARPGALYSLTAVRSAMPPYHEKYAVGTTVKIVAVERLEAFRLTWKYHNKLVPEQFDYADRQAEVEGVRFYHGGDVLYKLKGVPGIWHEECLELPST
jgi:hypothetical protein